MTDLPRLKLDDDGNPVVVDGRLVYEGEGENAVETVKVKAGDGFALINKADFDSDAHKLFDETKARRKAAAADAAAPEPAPETARPARAPARRRVAKLAAERSVADAAPVGSTTANIPAVVDEAGKAAEGAETAST